MLVDETITKAKVLGGDAGKLVDAFFKVHASFLSQWPGRILNARVP